MAQHKKRRSRRRLSVLPGVDLQIGAAEPNRQSLDQDLSLRRFRLGYVPQPERVFVSRNNS